MADLGRSLAIVTTLIQHSLFHRLHWINMVGCGIHEVDARKKINL